MNFILQEHPNLIFIYHYLYLLYAQLVSVLDQMLVIYQLINYNYRLCQKVVQKLKNKEYFFKQTKNLKNIFRQTKLFLSQKITIYYYQLYQQLMLLQWKLYLYFCIKQSQLQLRLLFLLLQSLFLVKLYLKLYVLALDNYKLRHLVHLLLCFLNLYYGQYVTLQQNFQICFQEYMKQLNFQKKIQRLQLKYIKHQMIKQDIYNMQIKLHIQYKLNIKQKFGFNQEEVRMLKSTLELRDQKVCDKMIPIDNVYMLSTDSFFDRELIKEIHSKGYSMIPIYKGNDKTCIEGVLRTKYILKCEEKHLNKPIANRFPLTNPLMIVQDTTMLQMIQIFQSQKSSMAFITDEIKNKIKMKIKIIYEQQRYDC
ncbi:hypothetical protein IMG5_001400 [Ichthyophthirius multifiliis]|uniref:CBS domain-containing protein n=1 Tax=Ichthyophthirius multifiliis TaxID=5932 RepID=G0QIV1_ICHMU|nr:hypothetical protein IMG5_001400 [Ichthyophthirius multifiliis]EGR34911.1 hypothetical protein IMG5_001400 [Ichthyophthirius multifiliis]|eukprot:XP_004040215.1 hypothetical protein IMG5_001400 [Ichthyophthirius multifiliis]